MRTQQPTFIFNGEKWNAFPLRLRTRQECFLCILFNIVLAVLVRAIRQQPEIREFQIGKKDTKLILLAKNMRVFTEIPKDTTKKLLEIMNIVSKSEVYKINIQKSIAFLPTNNEL